ncbi:DUF188 domain-containing protein [Clostridium sp. D2Q-14]|uniref:DUF188 domain-containing protein n=1 Tax=Anaeromonas gelatinilytica TaxID=2683194 RepID=UPI00193BDB8B|nr:DUF188 domain-containing protein [Anaeromonas gelatinilytica]MBS4535289.1 DUF188 domain-containing protein [Anaeromonas gelatinilytica]
MKILVDSDACPVKNIINNISNKYNIETFYITSVSHYSISSNIDQSKFIYVDNTNQSADIEILNRAVKKDIVITDDYGLASLVLSKGCYCVSSKGYIYNKNNINNLLTQRYISMKERKLNNRVKGGPKKRRSKDDEKFTKNLIKMLNNNFIEN